MPRKLCGFTIHEWECAGFNANGNTMVRYRVETPTGATFEGADYGLAVVDPAPLESDQAILGLLPFLTCQPGDVESDFFASYTPEQMAWAESYECEVAKGDVYDAEEAMQAKREARTAKREMAPNA